MMVSPTASTHNFQQLDIKIPSAGAFEWHAEFCHNIYSAQCAASTFLFRCSKFFNAAFEHMMRMFPTKNDNAVNKSFAAANN